MTCRDVWNDKELKFMFHVKFPRNIVQKKLINELKLIAKML